MSALRKVAVIGANGFVGSRIVEMFHLGGVATVAPVVRTVPSLARISRFTLDWRLADASDVDSLAKGLAGCDALVHSVVGDPRAIKAAARALPAAAARAGIKRIVYLSTASVHGQNPAPGTTEASPLSDKQDVDYNNAKVRAETILFHDATRLGLEVVALRPSVVFGPRDRWISSLTGELQKGTAWLVDDGVGICNSIYVDNLVHAVRCGLDAPSAATGSAYLVGDPELVTWRQVYEQTAQALGFDPASIHRVAAPQFPPRSFWSKADALRASPAAQRFIAHVPTRLKGVVKGAIKGLQPFVMPNSWQLPRQPGPSPDRERVMLQQCRYRLPDDKARTALGYAPPVSFSQGLHRTLAWLEWSGQVALKRS